jgi:hypothetical protein
MSDGQKTAPDSLNMKERKISREISLFHVEAARSKQRRNTVKQVA